MCREEPSPTYIKHICKNEICSELQYSINESVAFNDPDVNKSYSMCVDFREINNNINCRQVPSA